MFLFLEKGETRELRENHVIVRTHTPFNKTHREFFNQLAPII